MRMHFALRFYFSFSDVIEKSIQFCRLVYRVCIRQKRKVFIKMLNTMIKIDYQSVKLKGTFDLFCNIE